MSIPLNRLTAFERGMIRQAAEDAIGNASRLREHNKSIPLNEVTALE